MVSPRRLLEGGRRHDPDALDAAPLEFESANLGMMSPGKGTECMSIGMWNWGSGAIHGDIGAAAHGAAAAWFASGDASRPSTTSPDRANGVETSRDPAVEAIGAKNCADASGVSGP